MTTPMHTRRPQVESCDGVTSEEETDNEVDAVPVVQNGKANGKSNGKAAAAADSSSEEESSEDEAPPAKTPTGKVPAKAAAAVESSEVCTGGKHTFCCFCCRDGFVS